MSAQPTEVSRWKCTVAYDGSALAGWQIQPNAETVQSVIEARLAAVFKTPVDITGSGRTDSGVHARGQVFHFDAQWSHDPAKLLTAMRIGLPPTIQILTAKKVPATFHARFSAKGKIYHYDICHGAFADPFTQAYTWSMARTLDIEAMRAAAKLLVGTHDFRAFTAMPGSGVEKEDTVRTVKRLDITGRGTRLRIAAEGNGFLYKMVRSLTGALVDVGAGRLKPDDMTEILASQVRTQRVFTAPPQGLCLVKVFY
ncbi:tRNA pseudouridine(38-40) synthase TruA [Rariglobus hedericola]|uniref:tRNA pseudouridine synthase A n=1 Tax=Rariglobus hedericola TaxID=2597822 RepID=A0A556QQR9_9BACT|nr:tRNA pseudouridine(38-40) synthase TruA [Rariglobus hedericola]TSJ78986.1 tRNA pseudouridine(38-40) synthase TruA [Rariglobus hedericola]